MSNIDLETIKQNVPDAWMPSLDSLIVKGNNAEIWDKDDNYLPVAVCTKVATATTHINSTYSCIEYVTL